MLIFLIICSLLIPFSMIIIGLIWREHPPKSMNATYGYRTNSSMKNQETWDYTHIACSKVWIIMGSIVLAISLIFCVLYTKISAIDMESLSIIVTIFQCITLVLTIIPVGSAKEKHFHTEVCVL